MTLPTSPPRNLQLKNSLKRMAINIISINIHEDKPAVWKTLLEALQYSFFLFHRGSIVHEEMLLLKWCDG